MTFRLRALLAPLLTLALLSVAQAQPGNRGGGGGGNSADPPAFTEVIKDCTQIHGLFDLYLNEKTGQVFIAVNPDQFGPNFLVSTTLNAGTGGGDYIAPMLWPSIPVYFKQTYKTVQLIRPNTRMFAEEGKAIARAVEQGRSDSVLLSMMPASMPATEDEAAGKSAAQDDDKDKDKQADEKDGKSKERKSKDKGGRKPGSKFAPVQDDTIAMTVADEPAPSGAESDDADATSDDETAHAEGHDHEHEQGMSEDCCADKGGCDCTAGACECTPEPVPPVEGAILLDASQLFMGGILTLGPGNNPGIDPAGSFFTSLKSFPENTNVETTLSVPGNPTQGRGFAAAGGSNPDTRSAILKVAYSISKVPTDGYQPRYSDERVGYFLTLRHDFTNNTEYTRTVRYINRWKLEKKDPTAELSEPVEPIVYWIDNNTPEEFRDAVRAGVEAWVPAFEAAGFKNGIVAKQMPDDADWDPADVRYNVIRWFIAPGSAFAIGPSRANPYTGQLYDADIGFSADMVSFSARRYDNLVNPARTIQRQRLQAEAMGAILPPMVTELREANADPEGWVARQQATAAAMQRMAELGGEAQSCSFAEEAMDVAGTLYHACLMDGRFTPGSEEELEFLQSYVTAVTIHEVGHTLGLRHNYKASTFHSHADLCTDMAHETGLTGSVMDYTGVNIAPRGKTQGHYFQTKIGPYDIHAIKYGYGTFPGGSSPEGELAALQQLAAQGTQNGLAYATDDDAGGWSAAMDPTTQYWDLSDDPIAFYQDQIQVGRELLSSIDWNLDDDQTPYPAYRRMFSYAMGPWNQASTNVPRYIGGIVHVRHRVGDPDGQLPFTPVPAAKQREALNFFITNYWAKGAFTFAPDLVRKLSLERHADLDQPASTSPRRDYPIHQTVLSLQQAPLLWIYDPLVLQRMEDTPLMLPAGSDVLTIAELFGAVRGAIWQEAFEATNTDSMRRNLQREHLTQVIEVYLHGGAWYPEDAITLSRNDLVTLRGALDKALAGNTLDGITRAHFAESRDRIDETLSAVVNKGGGITLMLGG